MTDQPRDEFDRVPESSARQGVHRERPIPAQARGLGLTVTVGILALLIGVAAYFLLPRLDFRGPVGGTAASSTDPASGPDATAGPSTVQTVVPDARASATAETSGSDDDGIDRSRTVNVLNGTGVPGLASVAAGRLASAGWTAAVPGNWAGTPVDASVVFHNGGAQLAGAEAVAEDLGITNLVDSPDVSADISVVLGPDFQ